MKRTGILLFFGLVAVILVGAIYILWWMRQPLGEPLELVVPMEGFASGAEPAGAAAQALPAAQVQPTNPALTCGNRGVMSLFMLGVASPLEAGHQGADAIRLVVVDFDNVRVRILPLPSDLQVETPEDLVDPLGETAPLNLIYLSAHILAGGNNEDVRTRKATQTLAQTVLDVFAFEPDKYLAVNGDPFIDLVDQLEVGSHQGILVVLEEEVDGTPEFYGIFPAGANYLDGQRTLDFVRLLHPKGGPSPDYFGRFQRQNLVLRATLDAILMPQNWDAIPDLVQDARKMVVTDLSVDQARDLACMLELVEGQDLFIPIDDHVTIDAQGNLIPDVEAIRDLIQEELYDNP